MKNYFEKALRFGRSMELVDFALLKLCMLTMGMLVGLAIPWRKKKAVTWAAALTCVGTLVPLLGRYIPALLDGGEDGEISA